MKVLALFANPRGTSALRLGEEHRVLQECINRSKNRDSIKLEIRHAATIDDARRALLDDQYDVVHFSGHGTGNGLAFEDSSGRLFIPPQDAVAELLASFAPPLHCVLFNACYSSRQATFTALTLPFTIAMDGPIADDAAIVFSGAFYDSLAAGRDVPFSFNQGLIALKLAGHPDSVVPRLVQQGVANAITDVDDQPLVESVGRDIDPLVLGFAIDVSGSMESSINNKVGRQHSRLAAFQQSLERGIQRGNEQLRAMNQFDAPVSVFSYAFGLRTGDVCDLFSLVKIAGQVVEPGEIEHLKKRFIAEIEARYSGSSYGGLESLARQYLGGGLVESFKSSVRQNAEVEVRNRILAEIQRRLTAKLRSVGETTLSLNDLVALWKGSGDAIKDAEGLIFGNTPMCEALRQISGRFVREVKRSATTIPSRMLVLVSDGEATDGNPLPLAEALRAEGVFVVACYITDHDVSDARILPSEENSSWPKGARDMFHLASPVPDDSDFARYLLREGWRISNGSRAFIQANHSEILDELVGMAMSPIESQFGVLPKGK